MSNLFSAGNYAAELNIGKVIIAYGCGNDSYAPEYENPLSPGGQRNLVFTNTAMPCYAAGSGTPSNKEALDTLTNQFGQDFLTWLAIQFDYTFVGVCNIIPNGFIDEIEVDHDAGEGMAKTRIRSMPWNGWPTNLGHNDPTCPGAIGDVMLGLTDGIITARGAFSSVGDDTVATPGFGPVKVFFPPNAANTPAKLAGTITVFSWFSSQIPKGKACMVAKVSGCMPFLISADC